jgi:hypothetical protein
MPPIAHLPIWPGMRWSSSGAGMNLLVSPSHNEMLWWQPLAETPMKGLGMKQGKACISRPTCLHTWR